MAQNLNYVYKLPESGADSISFCYENDPANCEKYGRLYTWMAAIDSAALFSENAKGCGKDYCTIVYPVQGVCPVGWHIPTEMEWYSLRSVVGGWENADIWFDIPVGKNAYGFSAMMTGYKNDGGNYYEIKYEAVYWSSVTIFGGVGTLAGAIYFDSYFKNNSMVLGNKNKGSAAGVRCLKDELVSDNSSITDPILSNNQLIVYDSIVDSRDGQVYRTVKIGGHRWMAENLNYETENSYCYNDSIEYCAKYGRLYTWDVAVKGACPDGWHLPDDEIWKALFKAVGGADVASYYLRSTSGWYNSFNGTNPYGFSAVPAGWRKGDGTFNDIGTVAFFWSSDEGELNRYGSNAYLVYGGLGAGLYGYYDKIEAFSVRCVK